MVPTKVRVLIQDVENIWGVRRALYLYLNERMLAAVYDTFDNCLGGSCGRVERIVGLLERCEQEHVEVIRDVVSEYFAERVREVTYICPDNVGKVIAEIFR
jgi:hypothetical protein